MPGTEPVIKASLTRNPEPSETRNPKTHGTEPVIKASLVWDILPGISPSKGISASNAISRSKGTRSPQQSTKASTVRDRTSTSPTTVCGISPTARGRALAQGRRTHARMHVCMHACMHACSNARTCIHACTNARTYVCDGDVRHTRGRAQAQGRRIMPLTRPRRRLSSELMVCVCLCTCVRWSIQSP